MSVDEELLNKIALGEVELLDGNEICTRLKISRSTFDRWCRADPPIEGDTRTIPFPPPDIRMGGGPRWSVETFKAWIRKCMTDTQMA